MTDQSTMTAPMSINDLRVSMELKGTVRRIELFGAFVDVGVGVDALLHISQLGQNVRNVDDMLKVGDEITVFVLRLDASQQRIALSFQQPPAFSWDDIQEGAIVTGRVIKLEKYGAFIDFGAERPGMIHVSEMANGFVNSPSDVLKEGEEIRAAVISVNKKKRRIDLSIKKLEEPVEVAPVVSTPEEPVVEEYVPNAMEIAFRKAYSDQGEEMPERRDKKRDKRGDKRDRRREMDDIYDRTLRNHGNN